MSVVGVGGAASLPKTLTNPSHVVAPSTIAGSTGTTVTGATSSTEGDGRLPGHSSAAPGTPAAAAGTHKETPKPAPLPPLRGLTVAEIRAMLGVAPLPGQTEITTTGPTGSSGPTGTTAGIPAAVDRYA